MFSLFPSWFYYYKFLYSINFCIIFLFTLGTVCYTWIPGFIVFFTFIYLTLNTIECIRPESVLRLCFVTPWSFFRPYYRAYFTYTAGVHTLHITASRLSFIYSGFTTLNIPRNPIQYYQSPIIYWWLLRLDSSLHRNAKFEKEDRWARNINLFSGPIYSMLSALNGGYI